MIDFTLEIFLVAKVFFEGMKKLNPVEDKT